jgi:hypothetical protein
MLEAKGCKYRFRRASGGTNAFELGPAKLAQEMHTKCVMRYGDRMTLFSNGNGENAFAAVTQAKTGAARRGVV